MSHDAEYSILQEVAQIANEYELSRMKAVEQLETHDARIRQHPITAGIPVIIDNSIALVMRIPIREHVLAVQVKDLIEGIEMPVELVAGINSKA